jgi:hypothetical protein
MKKMINRNVLTLSLGIALLPPLWAVIAPYIGITTGAVALICAGVYVANGNNVKDGLRIMLGFWCGDAWAVLALVIMKTLQWNENLELFVTLFVLGGLAVIIASIFANVIFLPAWLCGWAIGLTIMAPVGLNAIGSLPVQIAAAMAAGVWYVGAGVDAFQKFLLKKNKTHDKA